MSEAADRNRHVPTKGFNLVGVDDFELPGSQLYLIEHFDTRAEAEAAQAARRKTKPHVETYIYGPADALK